MGNKYGDLWRQSSARLRGDLSTPYAITNNACVSRANTETADLTGAVSHVVQAVAATVHPQLQGTTRFPLS